MRGLLSLLLAIPLAVGCPEPTSVKTDNPEEASYATEEDWSDGSADDGGSGEGGAGTAGSGETDGGASSGSDTDTESAGVDADGDGVTIEEGDCDDTDDSIYPGAEDIWEDDIDQDCDGSDAAHPTTTQSFNGQWGVNRKCDLGDERVFVDSLTSWDENWETNSCKSIDNAHHSPPNLTIFSWEMDTRTTPS